jgi:hypothetical protein
LGTVDQVTDLLQSGYCFPPSSSPSHRLPSRPSSVTYYATQVTAAPVGNGPVGNEAAVFTLSARALNDVWTFLIAAVVDVAKLLLRVSRLLTASDDSETNCKRLSWLLDGKEKRKEKERKGKERKGKATRQSLRSLKMEGPNLLRRVREKTYSTGSNFWALKSSPILSIVDSIFCIIGRRVLSTAWLILSSPPIAFMLSTVAWRVD